MSFDQDPNEQANISGADLAILIDELAAEIKNKQEFERDWLECCDKLAESQAREKVLRYAIGYLANNLGEYAGAMQTQQQADVLTNYADAAFDAFRKPTDDTALKAALAAERERIAKHFDGKDEMFGDTVADAIRELGD